MRIGMRKPSVKRMIKARTTGRAKRAVKGAIYRRTTFSVWDLFR